MKMSHYCAPDNPPVVQPLMPTLIKEPGAHDVAGRTQHGPIAEPRIEQGIRSAKFLVAESMSRIQHDILRWIQRVGVDRYQQLILSTETLARDFNPARF